MDGTMGSQARSPAIANHSHLTGLLCVAAGARKPVTNTCDRYHSAARSRGIPPLGHITDFPNNELDPAGRPRRGWDDNPTACDLAELMPRWWWRLLHETLRIAALLNSGRYSWPCYSWPCSSRLACCGLTPGAPSFCTQQRLPTCLALPAATPCPACMLMTLVAPPHRQRRTGSPALLAVLLSGRIAGGIRQGVASTPAVYWHASARPSFAPFLPSPSHQL